MVSELAPDLPYSVLTAHRGLTEIKELLYLVNTGGGFVAGGYARYCLSPLTEPVAPRNVDLYCKEAGAYQYLSDEIVRRGGSITFQTSNAISIKPPAKWVACPTIQVINPSVMGGSPADTIAIFDFTIAMAVLTWEDQGIASKEFEEDEAGMQLRVNRIQCPIGTFKRALKYAKKGYKLSSMEMLKFYRAWDGLAPDKKEELVQLIATPHTERTPEDMEAYRRLVYID